MPRQRPSRQHPSDKHTHLDRDHVKGFYTSRNPLQALWHLPAQIFFAITGLLGLAQYARQIVRIVPKAPATVAVRAARQNERDDAEPESAPSKEVGLGEWVDENVASLRGVFKPTWWLPNGHLQTMYSVIGNFSKVDQVRYKRTYLRVPDGGTLGLDFAPTNYALMPDDAPTLVVCHGLTGGSHESYVRNVVAWLVKPKEEGGMGGRAVVVNFRGCAGVPVTSPQFYSAGTILDLSIALHYVRAALPHSPLHGIGFSLGASVLARYLGESSDKSLLSSGIVLGGPWDLPRMSVKLENHWFITPVYSRAMAGNLLRVLFSHYDRDPSVFDHPDAPTAQYMDRLKHLRKRGKATLKTVDELMVSKFGGPQNVGLWPFAGADEYYDWASPNRYITSIKRPTLAVNAFDDPIIDGEALPLPEILSSTHVYGAVTGGGGHLGWFEGGRAERRWILRPVSEWIRAAYKDFELAGSAVKTVDDGDKGWQWVEKPAHEVRGVGEVQGGGGGRLGWKVLNEGEVIRGEEGEGVMQGL